MNASCLMMNIRKSHGLEGTGRVAIPPSGWNSNNTSCSGVVSVDTVTSKLRSMFGNN